MKTIAGTPGLISLDGWVSNLEEIEKERMEEISNNRNNNSGSMATGSSNRTKKVFVSNAPTDHPRGR